ncbi:MAG: hypothetical protein U5L45_22625 [Saprospiraceae bacterium]|nr:hypothetical protein [Saprospiraceae bacterium]
MSFVWTGQNRFVDYQTQIKSNDSKCMLLANTPTPQVPFLIMLSLVFLCLMWIYKIHLTIIHRFTLKWFGLSVHFYRMSTRLMPRVCTPQYQQGNGTLYCNHILLKW